MSFIILFLKVYIAQDTYLMQNIKPFEADHAVYRFHPNAHHYNTSAYIFIIWACDSFHIGDTQWLSPFWRKSTVDWGKCIVSSEQSSGAFGGTCNIQ